MTDLKAVTQRMYDAVTVGNDVDAAIETYFAEDFVQHEWCRGRVPHETPHGKCSR